MYVAKTYYNLTLKNKVKSRKKHANKPMQHTNNDNSYTYFAKGVLISLEII